MTGRVPTGDAMRSVGVFVVLTLMLMRMVVAFDPMPYWQGDPTVSETIITGVTPAWSVTMDVLTMLAAAGVLVGESLVGRKVSMTLVLLFFGGCAGAMLHAALVRGDQVGNIWLGSNWAAAWAGAIALWHAGRDGRLHRLATAVSLAIVVVLVARGAVQVLIEHAETVRSYEASKQAFLEERGWREGSPSHLAYERRLYQNDATGWFGLSNVYATVVAVALTALLGMGVIAARLATGKQPRITGGWAGMIVLGAVAAGAGLWWSNSTGGIGSTLVGLACLALAALVAPRYPLPAPIRYAIGPAIVISVIAAIIARGVIGERWGELSILFRSFYLSTAARVFVEHPLGVGPAGFQQAYMALKPAISTEDVASPHSVLLDYAACLGVLGLGWAAAILMLGSCVGSVLATRSDQDGGGGGAAMLDRWFLLGAVGIPLIASTWIEAPLITPENLLLRLVGLLGGLGLGAAVLALTRVSGWYRAALAAGALAGLAHAQLEVTPVTPGSSAWLLAMIALAASPAPSRSDGRSTLGRMRLSLALVPAVAAVAWIVIGLAPLWRWEANLRRAGEAARIVGQVRTELLEISASPARRSGHGHSFPDLTRLVADLLGTWPAATPEEFTAQMTHLTRERAEAAARFLASASEVFPTHFPTVRAASRMHLSMAEASGVLGDGERADQGVEAAIARVRSLTDRGGAPAAAWVWLGDLLAQAGDEEWLHESIRCWLKAADLDPHGLIPATRLAHGYRRLELVEASRQWAARALRIDENMRLDALERLGEDERRELLAMAGGG